MTCYVVPAVAAIIHFFMMKSISSLKNNRRQKWLSHLLIGGAMFGIIDHMWNGELLLFGENLFLDLMLGVTITVAIFLVWGVMVVYDKSTFKTANKLSD